MPIPARLVNSLRIWSIAQLLLAGGRAIAADCGCSQPTPFEQAYAEANIVLSGKVIGVQTNPNKVGLLVTFQVDSSWKRPIEPFATVYTEYETGCGYPFRQGSKYLVFVNKGHSSLFTSICEPNSPDYAAHDLRLKLGKGLAPSHTPGTENLHWILTAAVMGGILFLAFVVLFRRGRRK
jgi:hypothetical protein